MMHTILIVFLLKLSQQLLPVSAIPARHHHVRLHYAPKISLAESNTITNALPSANITSTTKRSILPNAPSAILFTIPQIVNLTSTFTQYPPTTTVFISTNHLGDIHTALETQGHPSLQPFPTAFLPAVVTLSPVFSPKSPTANQNSKLVTNAVSDKTSVDLAEATPTKGLPWARQVSHNRVFTRQGHKRKHHHHHRQHRPDMDKRTTIDCFQSSTVGPIPDQITARNDHPVSRLGISPYNNAISTNKFYANLFLGNQNQGVWTHPYSLTWSKGGGNLKSWGMAVSHIEDSQLAFGPRNRAIPGSPVQYYINPIGIQSIILSAIELGSSTKLTTDGLQAMSVSAVLSPQLGSRSHLTFPMVQGMAFVTAIYANLMPAIQSAVYFRTFTQVASPRPGIYKYRIMLEDGKSWLLYATPSEGSDPKLKLVSSTQVQGIRGWTGMIQVAKNPLGAEGEKYYDLSVGVYASHATISASVVGTTGTYEIKWTKAGFMRGQSLLMYALPHHTKSFSSLTASKKTPLQLQTTTKGVATAILADSWTLVESNLPTDMGFAPWTPTARSKKSISVQAHALIQQVATSEINQDINAQTNLDSMYFSGKALSKFAILIYTMHDLLNQKAAAMHGLARLKTAFARFVDNTQINPLVYDTVWKGVVSSGGYSGDLLQDFGNTAYNDHHFHYGYFIHTAAIIGYLDPSWLSTGTNKAWIDTLIRDTANPSTTDPLFPFSRSFDWYNGHSWAKGLFESADGKDEESTSEDAMFAYALLTWGRTTSNPSLEARGTLMLAILARTLDNYFLLTSANKNQPPSFIANKVTGILFENKVDHTTYFGALPEYIQGIHMLPLLPSSTYIRSATFIEQEWSAYFAPGAFDDASSKVAGGWRGVLWGNWACVQPQQAWKFFIQAGFDPSWIDGGASRTWYLAFSAALAGL